MCFFVVVVVCFFNVGQMQSFLELAWLMVLSEGCWDTQWSEKEQQRRNSNFQVG